MEETPENLEGRGFTSRRWLDSGDQRKRGCSSLSLKYGRLSGEVICTKKLGINSKGSHDPPGLLHHTCGLDKHLCKWQCCETHKRRPHLTSSRVLGGKDIDKWMGMESPFFWTSVSLQTLRTICIILFTNLSEALKTVFVLFF